MSNVSARDLLRRSREQKKKQQTPATSSHQPLSNDTNAHIDSKGRLRCLICNVQVNPADVNSWKIHVASRRHQQGQATKRAREPDTDISQLSIEDSGTEDTAKRQKVEDGGALLAAYESDESEALDDNDIAESDMAEDSGLPPGVFDDNDDSEAQTGLPSGFFDNPDEQAAAETGATLEQANGELDDRLAEFESDIAKLATEEPNDVALPGDNSVEADLDKEAAELEQQSKMWRQRTDKLIHLRSIIKDGVRDMDPSDHTPAKPVEDSGSDSSDSEDFTELTDWRFSKNSL
ncbi:hypothetical protein GGI20_002149 [Coemansia sp. BCRC 34301]|nr:hypothetical protein GGI20_002149 [Coemansia sp. BCRC 34301]